MRLGSTTTAAAVALGSLAVSAALALYLDGLFLFLLVPFVPLLFGGDGDNEETVRECPSCGFRTRDDGYAYCPRDGERLRDAPLYQD